jgi:hypothetical protein
MAPPTNCRHAGGCSAPPLLFFLILILFLLSSRPDHKSQLRREAREWTLPASCRPRELQHGCCRLLRGLTKAVKGEIYGLNAVRTGRSIPPRDAARPRSDASRPRPACDSARPRPRDVAIGSRLLALRLSRPRFHYCPRRNGGAGSGPSTVMVEGALSVQLWKKAASRSPTQRRPRGGRGRKLFFKQHQLGVFEIYFGETLHLNTSSTIAKWDL